MSVYQEGHKDGYDKGLHDGMKYANAVDKVYVELLERCVMASGKYMFGSEEGAENYLQKLRERAQHEADREGE